VDLETTGLHDDVPTGIVEAGWCDVRYDIIHDPLSYLVNCEIPVSIGARAVHHISDAMVAGAIAPDQAAARMMDGMTEDDFFCAHNIDHERKYFGGGALPWICTYKTSLRIWPDAPGHKLMELAYHLKIDEAEDFDLGLALPLHRAAGDAYVCAHLLRRILKEGVKIEQLVRWSSGPALVYMCFLRKHKGKPWSQVAREDRSYLEWIISDKCDLKDRDILATVKYWLKQTAPQPSGGN
jgi:exodeoxyribonuclease X